MEFHDKFKDICICDRIAICDFISVFAYYLLHNIDVQIIFSWLHLVLSQLIFAKCKYFKHIVILLIILILFDFLLSEQIQTLTISLFKTFHTYVVFSKTCKISSYLKNKQNPPESSNHKGYTLLRNHKY